MQESRVVESEIPTGEGLFRVLWVEGEEPVLLEVPRTLQRRRLTAEEAYSLGTALVEHAEDSGYNPETGETEVR